MQVRDKINIDFGKALGYAEKLDCIADSIGLALSSEVTNSRQMVNMAWEGENAAHFIAEYDALMKEMKKTETDLHKISYAVKTTASIIYGAELAALQHTGTKL